MRGLKDRTVIVTGGANGIGAAIARRLAEEGCAVGIFDMDAAAGEKVAGEIKAGGGRASFHAVDITDYDAVARAVERFEVLPSGRSPVSSITPDGIAPLTFLDTTPDFWRKVVDINLFGPLNVNHVVLRGMAARGFGRVVNIASDAGRVGSSGEAVYSACKGGIIAFTKTIARELVGKGIILNTLCPGPTDTAILRSFLEGPDGARIAEGLKRAIPMRRLGVPDDYPGLVAFLLSRRRRLHHRPDHQRLGRPHHARIMTRMDRIPGYSLRSARRRCTDHHQPPGEIQCLSRRRPAKS